MRCGKAILGLVLGGLVPSHVLAQSPVPVPILKEGDTIIGMGALQSLTKVAINDNDMWTALVDTSFANTDKDEAILRNGFVTLREGTSLFSPANSSLDAWASIVLTNKGDLGMIVQVKAPTSVFDGAYWNLIPVAIKGSVIDSPALGANSTWDNMDVVRLTSSNRMLVLGEIQNTAVGTSTQKEDALIAYQLDNVGNVLSTEVLATKAQFVPILGTTVNTLGNVETLLAQNERGDYFTVIIGVGVTALLINMDTLVAQEGNPAPVTGRVWRTLSQSKLGLNDRGDFVYSGALLGDTSTYLIVTGNMADVDSQHKFVQSDDILPDWSSLPLGNGSAAPLLIANTGDIFWRAAAAAGDDAFMRNKTPIVQLNKTVVQGNLVTKLETLDSFTISPNGRFFLGRVELQVVGSALLLVDFGLVLDIPSCTPNAGKLTKISGESRIGQTLTLGVDQGQIAGALPVLLFSTQQRFASPGSTCGVTTPYGELMISTAHKVASVFLPPWNGTQLSVPIPIPNQASLVDTKLFAQAYFRDTSHTSGEDVRLTNALRIEIGAP